MSATAKDVDTASKPERATLEDFLFHEARLLDEQRMDEWGELFTEDGEYWVPASHAQEDPHRHVSLVYDPPLLRQVRIKRFRHPNAFSMQPSPHTIHMVGNVMLDDFDAATGNCVVHSKLIVVEFQREPQKVYGGTATHHLVGSGESYKIKMKKVVLTNCEGMLDSINIPF